MTRATGIGSMPVGTAAGDPFARAVGVVLEELPDLPHLPELPGRGPEASSVGRGIALLSGLGADLQPAGWRLTDAAGRDQRRARSLLAQDLDVFEEASQGWSGTLKTQVVGPWTLAASVEKPRGDRVLSDHGARRDLAQGLAEGVAQHLADLRRRVPGAQHLVVQLDEPGLAAVLAGAVPTASGFGRHRAVHPPEAGQGLGWVLQAIHDAGAEAWVHVCTSDPPLSLLRQAGARGLSVDLAVLSAGHLDTLAEALESGETVVLGVLPRTGVLPGEGEVTESVTRLLEMLGLDPAAYSDTLVLSPACGLADSGSAREALALLRTVAGHLTD